MDAWLAASGVTGGPILRRVRGRVAGKSAITGVVLNQRLRALAKAAGLPSGALGRLSGHSFRVGAAHDLVTAGRTLLEVMRAGRWTHADSVAHYVRHAPVNPWTGREPGRHGADAPGRAEEPERAEVDRRRARRWRRSH